MLRSEVRRLATRPAVRATPLARREQLSLEDGEPPPLRSQLERRPPAELECHRVSPGPTPTKCQAPPGAVPPPYPYSSLSRNCKRAWGPVRIEIHRHVAPGRTNPWISHQRRALDDRGARRPFAADFATVGIVTAGRRPAALPDPASDPAPSARWRSTTDSSVASSACAQTSMLILVSPSLPSSLSPCVPPRASRYHHL